MKSFKEFFDEEKIEESLIGSIKSKFNSIKRMVIALLSKLKISFGRKKTITIFKSKPLNESLLSEKESTQALYGYHAEFVTVYRLLDLINKNGLAGGITSSDSLTKVEKTGEAAVSVARKRMVRHNLSNGLAKNNKTEFSRNVKSGMILAESIFNDGISGIEDLYLCEFIVSHTGDLLKGISTADAKLTIKKKDSSEIITEILASLKAYKKWNINLSNNTIMSFLHNSGLDEYIPENILAKIKVDQNIRENIHKILKSKNKSEINYNQAKTKIEKLYGTNVFEPVAYEFAKDDNWGYKKDKNVDKDRIEKYNKALQQSYLNYVKISSKTLQEAMMVAHAKNKDAVNNNILQMLGFSENTDDDFYLAVANKDSIQVVSSKTSKKYKDLVNKLRKDFKLIFQYDDKKIGLLVRFEDPNGKLLLKGNISFSKTSSVGSVKTNFWIDFSSLSK